MLLKSIKHMQVHIIQYRNAGDDEIETFGITITSHRWSWINIYKFTEWTLGPKIDGMRSCSSAAQVEEILTPQGCIKGDRLGPQLWAEKGSAATVVSGRNYVQNVHIADTATTHRYI